jgi:predicted membrane metal-binding protein
MEIMTHFFVKHFHLIHIPPLFIITLFFIIGIIWHTAFTFFCAIFALLLCISSFAYIKQIGFSKQMVLCSFFTCIGAFLHQKEIRDYDNFYNFVTNKKITITGTVIDKYEVTVCNKKSTVTSLAIDLITTESCTQKSNKIMLLYDESNNTSCVGDIITFFNIRCKKPTNESFQHYQIKEQIIATLFENNLEYSIDYHPIWSLRYYIWQQKKRILENVAHALSPDTFRFFSSLFLGNRMCIKTELEKTNEQFKIWGISHFLARSGLHLALFVFIWQALFCLIPLSFRLKQLIITLLSCIYFILTWTSAPFTRSFALFLLNKVCFATKIPFHLLHYLTFVCFCFLLYCPLYLFFLDFQLSFALTFALAWFNQVHPQYSAEKQNR